MTLKLKSLKTLECKKCGHKWVPRRLQIKMCPRCKSIKWQKGKNVKKELLRLS